MSRNGRRQGFMVALGCTAAPSLRKNRPLVAQLSRLPQKLLAFGDSGL